MADLQQHTDKMQNCLAVFLGPIDSFAPTQMAAGPVKTYLQAGGRVFVSGEYYGSFDPTSTNTFLAALGSSMVIGDPPKYCNCNISPQWTGTINVDVPMLANVDAIFYACTTGVSGGTWLAQTNIEGPPQPPGDKPPYAPYDDCTEAFTFIAMEKSGKGYLIACGDSDLYSYGSSNCDFWTAFITNPTDKML